MTSKIVVNNIEADSGINTITFINEVTAPTFNGNIVGTAATFSGNVDIAGALTYEDVTNVDSVGIITARSGIHVTGGSVGIGTDNPNASLHVEKDGTSQVLARFESNMGTNNNRSISINSPTSDSGSEPFIFKTGNAYQFQTDDQVGLHINYNRKIGIGTDNPGFDLEVVDSSADCVIALQSPNSSNTEILFGDPDSSYSGRIRYGHSTNHLQFNTNAAERLRITSDGKIGIGVDPANVLHIKNDSPIIRLESSATNYVGRNTIGQYQSGLNIDCDNDDVIANSFTSLNVDGNERLRIDSDGRVLFAGATSSNTERLYVKGSSSTTSGIFIHNANGATNSSADLWFGHWTSSSTPSAYAARISALNKNVNTGVTDLLFHVYDGNNALERLRITSAGQLLHTRTDDVQRYDLEFRHTGGISDGNYGGIHWSQGATGSTNLGAIEIAYANTGRPDIVF